MRKKSYVEECKLNGIIGLQISSNKSYFLQTSINHKIYIEVKMSMHVVKRDGRVESVHFDKITSRITKLAFGLDSKVRN